MWKRAALGAVALWLALPGVAGAQSFSVTAQLREPRLASESQADDDGPVLAGDQVLWWERRAGASVLVAARAGEPARDLLALAAPAAKGVRTTYLTLTADGSRAVVQRLVVVCPGSGGRCRGHNHAVADDRLMLDLATGAVTPFDACLGGADCHGCQPPDGLNVFTFDLAGSVLTETDGCGTGSGVLDLADGATRRFDGLVVATARRYAIVLRNGFDDDRADLVDWRTGATVQRLPKLFLNPQLPRQLSVADDGTVAWTESDVSVLAPGATRRRTIALPRRQNEGVIDQVRLAGGLLAARRVARDRPDDDINTFQVSAPDGSQVRPVDGQRVGGGWAFDGHRLAWATQPCAQIAIQVWDLAGSPPPKATEKCAPAAIDRRRIHLRGTRELPVILKCPPAPAQGCAGVLLADLRRPHGRKLTSTLLASYRLPAGTTRRVRLAVLEHQRLRGERRLVAALEFLAYGKGGATEARVNVTRR